MLFSPGKSRCLLTSLRLQALIILMALAPDLNGQKLATLEVPPFKSRAGLSVIVSTNLDALTFLPDSALDLVQVRGNQRVQVPFQVEAGPARKLTWVVDDRDNNLRFELIKKSSSSASVSRMTTEMANGGLTLKAGNRNLLRYQFETMLPPAGINEIFKRSGFIHPLWTRRGQVLTRIQPPDHYHHYGLWNPWTHVLFEGDTVDFWNLNAKQGTVRFSAFISVVHGEIFGEYAAVHDHVALGKGQEKVAIRELQTVRIYAPEGKDYYFADITVQMTCPAGPVRLLEYRYGGMGWRATEQWTRENSRVLTSDGKTRKDADGSTARWCIVEGAVDGENAGAVLMSHPTNYNHPEPLRIWPENANGNRGDMFANFSPTKNMDWELLPGKSYVLRYRFIVFNGQFSKEMAEAAWLQFASPVQVNVVK